MIIETFIAGPDPVYERFAQRGRMLPDGLQYVDSWIDAAGRSRCFQLMETEDAALLDTWMSRWSDIVAFEVVEVIDSGQASSA